MQRTIWWSEFTLSEEDMGLMEDWHLKEVGMPIDRREGCHIYPHCNSLPPPRWVRNICTSLISFEDRLINPSLAWSLQCAWMASADGEPASSADAQIHVAIEGTDRPHWQVTLHIVLAERNSHFISPLFRWYSPDPSLLLYCREQRIVHVNVSWVNLTGYAAIQCEGKTLSSLFDESTDEKSLQTFSNLVRRCRKTKEDEISYGDENSIQCSTYSSDSESSEDTLFTATPATASIVLLPPTGSVKSSNYKKSFQLNPWGASKIPLRPKLALNVSPAAIKLKHFAFLFSDPMPKKTDKAPKCDLTESPATRKRSKSTSAPVTPAKQNSPTQQRLNSPRDSGTLPHVTCKFAFGTSSYAHPCNAENGHAIISTSSSDENARKLIKCSSFPPQSAEKARVIFESLTIPAHSAPSAPGTNKSTTPDTCIITRNTPPLTHAETDSSLMNKIER